MPLAKGINVLIYSGPSTSLSSVRHAIWSLRRLLGAHYSIQPLSADQLLKEPWPATCALLVMPGGADVGYCRVLNGAGNRRIKAYVHSGGKFLGLCAGGYYGSARCEFELGRPGWEVVGERELAFYPGICRGLALEGYVYGSERGARAVQLRVTSDALRGDERAGFTSYYNGGGVFVNAHDLRDRGVEVLAGFVDDLAVEAGEAKAAVVYCKAGEGAAILTGPHPEFAAENLNRDEPSKPKYGELIDALLATDQQRVMFLKACLGKLGLQVSQEAQPVPSLSHLHLSSAQPGEIAELLQSWTKEGLLREDKGIWRIQGENDTFILPQTATWNLNGSEEKTAAAADVMRKNVQGATSTFSTMSETSSSQADASACRTLDYNAHPKTLIPHTRAPPSVRETPHFNHAVFYSSLQHYQSQNPGISGDYGRIILYGEVVTSTQTMLEKNLAWLARLPIGTTATATTQISGRGRGTNAWVSPPGSMMFSTVIKHSLSLSTTAPVVFVQYLAALAVVTGIHGYGRGYHKLPIRLKWPNDIYALDPSSPSSSSAAAEGESGPKPPFVKVGGILVNTSYSGEHGGGDYTLTVGIGLNLSNATPTTSLSLLCQNAQLPEISSEKLLASILAQLETLHARFCAHGWNRSLEDLYYASWLHADQIVTLEDTVTGDAMTTPLRARIRGITRDWGMLVVEECDARDPRRLTMGRRWELQTDANSFDFFRGLLRRKVL